MATAALADSSSPSRRSARYRTPTSPVRYEAWRAALPPLPQQSSLCVSPGQRRATAAAAARAAAAAAATAAAARAVSSSSPPKTSPAPARQASPLANPQDILDWGHDGEDAVSLVMPASSPLDDAFNNDPYLLTLADADFSSPSGYPSFLNSYDQLPRPDQAADQLRRTPSGPAAASSPSRRRTPPCAALSSPSQSTSRTGQDDSQDTTITTASGPESPKMPAPKRRRTSASGTKASGTKAKPEPLALPISSDDLFGDADDDLPTIDLTDTHEVPEELKKPSVDNRVKIAAFQCVICMDDVTTLTVTNCGHLFCQQCLHSSLHVESTRGKCPMCRSKIDLKPRASYTTKTKGFWPLELKLMTTTKKGKRKAPE